MEERETPRTGDGDMSQQITTYRGDDLKQTGLWYTDDRDYAEYFGTVMEFRLEGEVVEVRADDVLDAGYGERVPREGDPDTEREVFADMLADMGVDADIIAVRDWEDSGVSYVNLTGDVEALD